jgi:hypothetical protein
MLAVAALLIVLAVGATGCGSTTKAASGTTTTTKTTTGTANSGNATNGRRGQTFAAFQTCLASHGVKLSGQFGRPNGQSQSPTGQRAPSFSAKQQEAFAACRSKLPAAAQGGFRRGGTGGGPNPAFAKYTKCLRSHGVTFGGTNNQTAFRKASAACAKFAPTPQSGSATGGSG